MRDFARWVGLGARLDSKMAAASSRSKCWSLVTQIGLLHRWSVSTMDGGDSTGTKLPGETILGRRGSIYPWLRGISGAVSSGSGPAIRSILSQLVDVPLTYRYDSKYVTLFGPLLWAQILSLALVSNLVLVCWLTLSFTVAPSSETGLNLTAD